MSETVEQIEQAIAHQWHIRGRYRTPVGGPSYEYPVAIEGDNVILRDGDCGLAKPTRTIPIGEWEQLAMAGMWRLVGIWSFVRADDPAANEIAFCYHNPESAGQELYELRQSANTRNGRQPAGHSVPSEDRRAQDAQLVNDATDYAYSLQDEKPGTAALIARLANALSNYIEAPTDG